MCKYCVNGRMVMCSACGRDICMDVATGDEFTRPAYVTAGGDLYCDECGAQVDIGVGPAVDCNPELIDAGEDLVEGFGEYIDLDVYRTSNPDNPETEQP